MMEVTIIITSYKEPKTIGKCIESILHQTIEYPHRVIVSAPDDETLDVARKYDVTIFKDDGKGKSHAINQLLEFVNGDILIFTDGDVYLGKDSINNIIKMFEDKKVGCVTGRPIPQEDKDTKYGYFANFLFDAAHNIRKEANDKGEFIECSGYLFAFRNIIKSIPLDVAEDTIIPFKFALDGYKIKYVENAKVFVKNVDNLKDWINQKVRTSKAHETVDKYVDTDKYVDKKKIKRVKSFKNELVKGFKLLFTYPLTLKEFYWTIQLFFIRLYMWIKVKRGKEYQDNWETIPSTK